MGKLARINELEAEVEYWKKKAALAREVMTFIRELSEIPVNSVCYMQYGMTITSNPRDAAKVFLTKIRPHAQPSSGADG